MRYFIVTATDGKNQCTISVVTRESYFNDKGLQKNLNELYGTVNTIWVYSFIQELTEEQFLAYSKK